MALYHQAAFTITPETPIPEDAAPAIGIDETGRGEELATLSAEYAPDSKIDVDVTVAGTAVTVSLSGDPVEADDGELGDDGDPEDVPGMTCVWFWGDGTSETSHDAVQRHTYAAPGSYGASVTITRDGRPSVDLSIPIDAAV